MSEPDALRGEPALGSALAPVRRRYASWLGLGVEQVREDRNEDPSEVRALQLVLRLERDIEPSWHAAPALSASACALLCLDPQWRPEVLAYCEGHIRKVTRRARGAQWMATEELPHVGLVAGVTEVRAFVPGLASELDKRLSKLQVGGTDLPVDDQLPHRGLPLLNLVVPEEPALTAGKLMAQTGHAGMIAAALLADDDPELLRQWWSIGCPAHVERVSAGEFARRSAAFADPAAAWQSGRSLAVRDAGFTEVAPGTLTVITTMAPEMSI